MAEIKIKMVATLNDLKIHIDKLVSKGKGGRKLISSYDGFYSEIKIKDIQTLIYEADCSARGVCSGGFEQGDIIIE